MPDTSVPPAQPATPERPRAGFVTRFIATGLFSGYAPVAPGTAGSLVGLAIYLIPGFDSPLVLASAAAALFFIGVLTAGRMEKELGEDPPVVVVDEVVGMWISLFLLPRLVWICVLSFLFFRIFDIFKPPPARALEKYGGGWGIMLDDVAAGVYANLAVQAISFLIPAIR